MYDAFTPEEVLALSKLVRLPKGLRNDVQPGVYEVSEDIRVRICIEVGADEEYTPTSAIPIKTAFALFVKYSGVTGPHAMALLVRAFNDANDLGSDISELSALEDAEATVKESLSKLDKKTRKGKVRTLSTTVEKL